MPGAMVSNCKKHYFLSPEEKRTFFETFFLFCSHLKIKIILLQTTYRNMDIWTLLQYFPKNRAILVQKLWGVKKLSKSVFGYFKTKKKIQQNKKD